MKCRTKSKYSKLKSYRQGTGGGGPSSDVLTDVEQEIVDLINVNVLEGHKVEESAVNLPLPSADVEEMNITEFILPVSDNVEVGFMTQQEAETPGGSSVLKKKQVGKHCNRSRSLSRYKRAKIKN